MQTYYQDDLITLYRGDCREILPEITAQSINAVVTDPPYELGFMGKQWDKSGIAFQSALWQQMLAVLKPGGYALIAGIGRTHHRLMVAVEDAGFELKDCLYHVFAQGYPKSLAIDKAIDQYLGGEREVVATVPATPEAAAFSGYKSALKPAVEVWCVAMKPLDGTYAHNACTWGIAGFNVDGARIAAHGERTGSNGSFGFKPEKGWNNNSLPDYVCRAQRTDQGRYPSNLLLSHAHGCVPQGMTRVKRHIIGSKSEKSLHTFGNGINGSRLLDIVDETVEDWQCIEGCPVQALNRQAGERKGSNPSPGSQTSIWKATNQQWKVGYSDNAPASRFFQCFPPEVPFVYVPKASKKDRGVGNTHPTVKPQALMRYLLTLVSTPTGGLVLDPFAGSGTTLLAAKQLGCKAIGIELNPEYCDIIVKRLTEYAVSV